MSKNMSIVAIKEEAMDTTAEEASDHCADQLSDNQLKCEPTDDQMSDGTASGGGGGKGGTGSRAARRGRKNRRVGAKVDVRAKLERSRQSARECRARKKLRYQYLEDLVIKRESANQALKQELHMYREIFKKIDSGHKPQELLAKALDADDKQRKNNRRA